ncbi:MAG: tetratricopeptide repeat protein [Acidobacteria bacterium]|nr:tetratricopeptide repeat protein [Acidobacteriota bacterium]
MRIGIIALLWMSEANWREHNDRGLAHYRSGNYTEARADFERAIGEAAEPGFAAQSWNNLGAVHYQRGEFPEAERSYRKALALWAEVDRPASLYATCRINLSVLLRQTGRLDEAGGEAQAAVSWLNSIGMRGISLASAHHSLGEINRMREDLDRATHHLTLAQRELEAAPDRGIEATILQSLGTVWQDRRRFDLAEPLQRKALERFESLYGTGHALTAGAAASLGQTLLSANRLDEAEPYLHRALDAFERHYGPRHPRTALALNNVAQLARARSNFRVAEPLYRRAIDILRETQGPKHPDTGRVLANLGAMFVQQGKTRGAEVLFREALAISRGFQAAAVSEHLASLLEAQRRYTEARRVRQSVAN